MSRLANLLDELCPQGVEYRPLGEVGTFIRGGGPQKKDFLSEGLPCIHYGQIYTHYGLFTTSTISYVSQEVFDKSRKAQPGNVIIAVTSENDEDLGDAVAWLGSQPAAVSNHTLIYDTEMDSQYVSYFLRSEHLQKQKRRVTTGTKVRSISEKGFSSLVIPVPPLEVQQEIVRVLDAFTDLEQSLVSELELRKKQFEEYRLQAFGKLDADYVGLQSIATIGTGSRNTNEAVDKGAYPFYTRGEEVLFSDEYDFDETSIITAGDGVGVGKTMHFASGKFALHQRAYRINITNSCVEPRFVFHLMKATFLNYMIRNSVHASVTSVRKRMLDDFPVPVLATEVQQDIVSKLDAFESLIQSIEQEISLRRKQYEFYRDELLRFTPKGA